MAEPSEAPAPLASKLVALARLSAEVVATVELDARITEVLASLERHFGYGHSMLFVPADDGQELTLLACHGYAGGVGASVRLGEGTIGVAGERRRSLRINNLPRAFELALAMQGAKAGERAIPLPGLPDVGSQAAVTAVVEDRLALVLYVEDARRDAFGPDDTAALETVASLLAVAMRELPDETETSGAQPSPAPPASVPALSVRYYESDGSVFFDDEYVIKSLPGRILFRLLSLQKQTGRSEFTKKELRLEPTLKLPPVRDNLDTRLILLRRRLAERFPCVALTPVGRGRFTLTVDRPYALTTAAPAYP